MKKSANDYNGFSIQKISLQTIILVNIYINSKIMHFLVPSAYNFFIWNISLIAIWNDFHE